MINGTITNETGKFSTGSENHSTTKLEMETLSGPTIILQSQELTKDPPLMQHLVVQDDAEKLRASLPANEESSEWIKAISVITFDIDEGQVIENIYPSDALNPKEMRYLPLLSFPDSNSLATEGFCKYVFQLSKNGSIPLLKFRLILSFLRSIRGGYSKWKYTCSLWVYMLFSEERPYQS